MKFNYVEEQALHDATLAFLKISYQYVVVDTILFDATVDSVLIMSDLWDIASILAKVNSSRFGLLSCYGAIRH